MLTGPDDDAAPAPRVDDAATALAALVAARYGLSLHAVEPFEGGWDPAATVWTGVDATGSRYGVKVTTRDVTFGLSVAGSLAQGGTAGVVRPLPTLEGSLWTVDGDHVITVSPWLDGADAVELGPDSVDWFALGRVLRAVHDHPAPADVRPRRRGIRRVRRSLRALIDDVDTAYASGSSDEAARRWRDARPRLQRLVDAERDLKRTRGPAVRVTTHGDPHLGNVLLDVDGRPWLIDFDEAAVAPRELDLMLVELGVLFDAPLTDAHRALFRDGYGRDVEIDRARIARFGCVRAVEDATSAFLSARDGAPLDPAPFRMLDGILGPQGLVSLVESELERLPHSPQLTDTKDGS